MKSEPTKEPGDPPEKPLAKPRKEVEPLGPPAAVLATLLGMLVLSLGNLAEIIPFFTPLTTSPIFPFLHNTHDLLAGGVVFYAAYKYHARLGIAATLVYLVVHIPYGVLLFPDEAPEMFRVLSGIAVAFFGVWLIQRLRETEELRQILATKSPIGIYIVQDGKFVFINSQFVRDTGYAEEGLLGIPSLSIVHPEDREMVRGNAIAMLKGQRRTPYEYRIIKKNGDIGWSMESLVSIYRGGRRATLGYYMNVTERRRTEEALRLSEAKYRSLVDNALVGVYRSNLKGDIIYANDALVSMLEFDSAEQLTSAGALALYKNVQDRDALIRELTQKGKVNNLEIEILTRSGESRSFVVNASLEGATISGMLMDITERKQAEEKFAAIFDAATDGILLVDPETQKFYDGNQAICQMLGYTRQEIKNIGMVDIYPEEELLSVISKFERATNKEVNRFIDIPVKRKDGSIFYADINSSPGTLDSRTYQISMFRDAAERRLAEARLERIAQEWQTTFDSIVDPISIHDRDFRLVRVNQAFADLFQMRPEELIGKTCYGLLHATDTPVPSCPYEKTIQARTPITSEFFEPNLQRHLEVSASPIFNQLGEVTGCVHVTRDITERKKMDEQLILTDRLASIGQLASGIAHELNNPLTGVIGFSELLLEKDVPDDIKKDLIIINKEAKRTAGIVRGLLTFARKQETEKTPVNISNIVQEVLQLRSYEHRVNNIEVIVCFAPNLPEIMGSGAQLQQVFINLIINAEQAMLEAHGKGTLTVATTVSGKMVQISFTDDGPGISPENMRRLFTPFFTTKEVGKGTGLGLSICHGIVTEHGGRIYAESKLGKGATFIVELPAKNNHGAGETQ